jgi:hypothetical protein
MRDELAGDKAIQSNVFQGEKRRIGLAGVVVNVVNRTRSSYIHLLTRLGAP